MRPLFIVGAGGFGREVLGWLRHLPACGRQWQLAGFLDDDPSVLEGYGTDLGLAGPVSGHRPGGKDLHVLAIGHPATRARLVADLGGAGAEFLTLIHPTARVAPGASVGRGSILCPFARMAAGSRAGAFSVLNIRAHIEAGGWVGPFSTLSSHAALAPDASVGERSFLASGAVVARGIHLGPGSFVGAGSLVSESHEEGTRLFGRPAVSL